MLEENSQLWKNQRQQRWYEALKEQKETREMLQTYAPWGRPGCGAPDPEARERRRQQVEELRLQGTRRFGNGNSPGSKNGEVVGPRGGCGAPIRTRSGRIVTTRHPDPILFFQPQAAFRRTVEERLRYRSSNESKQAYKNDLDELVKQRKKAEAEERYRALKVDRMLGWTNAGGERKTQERKTSPKEQRKTNDFGVELVPLLIQKRVLNKRHSRCNTDVTSGRALWEAAVAERKAKELQYLQELNQQVAFKQQKMQILRITSTLLLLLACSVHCKPDVSSLDRSLAPPDPVPSPAPSLETKNPLKNPEVRRALIRALARSIEKLGANELDDLIVSQSTERPQSLFVRYFTSISTNNPAPTDPFGTVPPTEPAKEETSKENFPEVILNEVDKHIQTAEFQRVHPNEVHVTSKVAPQPFSAQQGKNDFTDSLTSPTEESGSEGNSLRQGPTTVKPQEDDIRVEQHELKSVEAVINDGSVISKPNEEKANPSKPNTVDIFRAPLIAAFTVHQDYLTGATRGVVPLIPPDTVAPVQSVPSTEVKSGSTNLPLQNEELQDLVRQITTHPASVQGRFPFLSREQVYQQELLERQRAAQRQAVLHRGQASFNQVQVQNNGVSEQQLQDQRLRKIRHLQELQYLQERLLRLQQQLQSGF